MEALNFQLNKMKAEAEEILEKKGIAEKELREI